MPDVIPGQIDMVPSERREVPYERLIDGLLLPERRDRPLEIDRIPQGDHRRHEVEPARAVKLVLVEAVALPPGLVKRLTELGDHSAVLGRS